MFVTAKINQNYFKQSNFQPSVYFCLHLLSTNGPSWTIIDWRKFKELFQEKKKERKKEKLQLLL